MKSGSLGAKVGGGRSADVHELTKDRVVKLFHAHWLDVEIEYEFEVATLASEVGIPTARPYDIVQHRGRKGIVFERLRGESLTRLLICRPWQTRTLLKKFAELHRSIHRKRVSSLRDQQGYLLPMIKNRADAASVVRKQWMDSVSGYRGDTLCHNDYHPGNILVTAQGLSVVDWSKGAKGHATLDVAITATKLGRLLGLPASIRKYKAADIVARRLRDYYLHAYFWPESDRSRAVNALCPAIEAALERAS